MLLKWAKGIRQTFGRIFSALGRFFGANPVGLSLTELVFTLLFSNAAIIFLVFTHLVDTAHSHLTWSTVILVIRENVLPSEVLVYLLALITPALWIMAYNWRARKHVAFYWLLLIVQAIIVIGSAYIYGKAKSGSGVGNPEFVEEWAALCLVVGLIIWFITLVYNRAVISKMEAPRMHSGESILRDLQAGG